MNAACTPTKGTSGIAVNARERRQTEIDAAFLEIRPLTAPIGIVRCRILRRIIGSNEQGGASWLTGGCRSDFNLQLFAWSDLVEFELHRPIVGLHRNNLCRDLIWDHNPNRLGFQLLAHAPENDFRQDCNRFGNV
jgi:hypothetical protein